MLGNNRRDEFRILEKFKGKILGQILEIISIFYFHNIYILYSLQIHYHFPSRLFVSKYCLLFVRLRYKEQPASVSKYCWASEKMGWSRSINKEAADWGAGGEGCACVVVVVVMSSSKSAAAVRIVGEEEDMFFERLKKRKMQKYLLKFFS